MPAILRTLLTGLTLTLNLVASCAAAEIGTSPLGDGDVTLISISGPLTENDASNFIRIALPVDKALVAFDSNGGNLHAGIEIGKAIRLKGYWTAVGDNATCASSCGLAWLGGTRRFISSGGSVGFHAAYRSDGGITRETGLGNALVGAYLNQLGLPQSAIAYITIAPPEDMSWLTPEAARQVGIEVDLLSASQEATTTFGRKDSMPSNTFRHFAGADIFGHDLSRTPLSGLSTQQCEAACNAVPGCNAYTYNNRTAACFLKTGGSRLLGNPLANAGIRASLQSTLRRSAITVYERTDFPGNDYAELRNLDFEECVDACEADSRCRAFTYVRRHQQCWLKATPLRAVPHRLAISGRK